MRSIAKNYLKLLIQDQIDTEDSIKDGAGLLNLLSYFLVIYSPSILFSLIRHLDFHYQ